MAILKSGEFDMAALKKSRQKKATRVDLLGGLRQVSPEIEQLKVGQTAEISGVKADSIRKTVMAITAKLTHLTANGGEWAGRKYEVASDADSGKVYVQRQTGVKPEEAPVRRTGGGRKSNAQKAAEAASNSEATNEAPESEATVPTAAIVEHA